MSVLIALFQTITLHILNTVYADVPLIIFGLLCRLGTQFILFFGNGIPAMRLGYALFGFSQSTQIIYSAHLYRMVPLEMFHRIVHDLPFCSVCSFSCCFVDRPVSWEPQFCSPMFWEVSLAARWWTWTKKAIPTGDLSSASLRPLSLSASACSSSPATFPGSLWRRTILHVLPTMSLAEKLREANLHLALEAILTKKCAFLFLKLLIFS